MNLHCRLVVLVGAEDEAFVKVLWWIHALKAFRQQTAHFASLTWRLTDLDINISALVFTSVCPSTAKGLNIEDLHLPHKIEVPATG
jgi:hypothetical protein